MTKNFKETAKELESLADNVINSLEPDAYNELSDLLQAYKYIHSEKENTAAHVDGVLAPVKATLDELNATLKPILDKFQQPLDDLKMRIELMNPESSEAINWRTDYKYDIVDIERIPKQFFKPDDAKIKKAIKAGVKIEGIIGHSTRSVVIKPSNIK